MYHINIIQFLKKSLVWYLCHQTLQSSRTFYIPISYSFFLKKSLPIEYVCWQTILSNFAWESGFLKTVSCNSYLSSSVNNNYTSNAYPSASLQDFLLVLICRGLNINMLFGSVCFVLITFLDVFWATVIWCLPLISFSEPLLLLSFISYALFSPFSPARNLIY